MSAHTERAHWGGECLHSILWGAKLTVLSQTDCGLKCAQPT